MLFTVLVYAKNTSAALKLRLPSYKRITLVSFKLALSFQKRLSYGHFKKQISDPIESSDNADKQPCK